MYEDSSGLTQEQIGFFLERMDSGEEVEAGSEVHHLMTAASERAMRITSRMNAQFDSSGVGYTKKHKIYGSVCVITYAGGYKDK